ncbi:MAG: F0F1 ATP synthase subunit B [Chloroflexi bacterium]|nr:F0F1 ATP synthase subunit B [Chloroflexota bacterium]
MEALGINFGFLLMQIFNFLLIFWLLRTFLWKGLINTIDERRAEIEKGLEDARIAADARENAEKEAENIRAEARSEAQKIIAEAHSRAEESAKEVTKEAEQEAETIRAEARQQAEQEREQLLADMRSQVISLAIAAANRLIGKSLDEKKQKEIVSDFFSKAPENVKNIGEEIEVVSALPLSDTEKNKVKDATGASKIDYKVDPSLLGGLIIRAGDRVVDGSVRSSLNAMRTELN